MQQAAAAATDSPTAASKNGLSPSELHISIDKWNARLQLPCWVNQSHRGWAATVQLWQWLKSGSSALFSKEAQIVQALYSGIKKALASTRTCRNFWAITSLLMQEFQQASRRDNPQHLFQKKKKKENLRESLIDWSIAGSAVKLMVLETRNS